MFFFQGTGTNLLFKIKLCSFITTLQFSCDALFPLDSSQLILNASRSGLSCEMSPCAPGTFSGQRQAAHSILRPFIGTSIRSMWVNLLALPKRWFPFFHLLPFLTSTLQGKKMGHFFFCKKDLGGMKHRLVVLQVRAVEETLPASMNLLSSKCLKSSVINLSFCVSLFKLRREASDPWLVLKK